MVRQNLDAWLELLGVGPTHDRVHAVSSDDQVGLAQLVNVRQSLAVVKLYVMRAAVALQDLQQVQASDAREAQPVDAHLLVAVHDCLVGPRSQVRLDLGV